jgi:hypothetical protein
MKDAPWFVLTAGLLLPFLTFVFGVLKWRDERREQRRADDRKRREANYRELLLAAQGFGVGADPDAADEAKQRFVDEYNLAWLYASDEVVRALNRFLHALEHGQSVDGATPEQTLADLVAAVRRDLLAGSTVETTLLAPGDYRFVAPSSPPAAGA